MTGAITIRSSAESDFPAIRDLALLDGGAAPRVMRSWRSWTASYAWPWPSPTAGRWRIRSISRPTSSSSCAPAAQERPHAPVFSAWLACGAGDPGSGGNDIVIDHRGQRRAEQVRDLERVTTDRPRGGASGAPSSGAPCGVPRATERRLDHG